MNPYCETALHQIEVAVNTIIAITGELKEIDLQFRPTSNKHSIGELLEHLAVICEADWRISLEATSEEMSQFYSKNSYKNIDSITENLQKNYQRLREHYLNLSEEQLLTKTSAYWGLTYTRYEWLLQIVAHLYHHRGQLHAMLVHCYELDPQVMLFE